MDVQKATIEDVFRKYTRLAKDRTCFILDVRQYKDWKRRHLLLSYCVRVSANGKALVDYSKNKYDKPWAQQMWWNADIIIIGDAGLKKDHEVARFLVNEGKASSVSLCKDGIAAFEKEYPFLVGQSLNAHRGLIYPSLIAQNLFLGNWANAEDSDKLHDLSIRRVVTIHNEPSKLKLPTNIRRMSITAPDLPTTDLSQYFSQSYTFIEEALECGRAVLIHCGAGSSRSGALCAAYLMRKHRWPAGRAVAFLLTRRSSVCPNEGFWRQLCAFEDVLGIPKPQRSDPEKPPVMSEAYGTVTVACGTQAAGERARVVLHDAQPGKRSREGAHSPARPGDRTSAEEPRLEDAKKAKRPGEPRLRVAVSIEVMKDGSHVTTVELPALAPLQTCTFGRGDEADVPVQHPSLSRAHAQLTVGIRGELQLMDLGSVHGTNINGAWVKAQQAKTLQVGAKFRFGASTRMYCVRSIEVQRG